MPGRSILTPSSIAATLLGVAATLLLVSGVLRRHRQRRSGTRRQRRPQDAFHDAPINNFWVGPWHKVTPEAWQRHEEKIADMSRTGDMLQRWRGVLLPAPQLEPASAVEWEWVDSVPALDDMARRLRGERVVGVDIEQHSTRSFLGAWRPAAAQASALRA